MSFDSSRVIVAVLRPNVHHAARFLAYYGITEDAEPETIAVEKCNLCGGAPLKRDNFKDCERPCSGGYRSYRPAPLK